MIGGFGDDFELQLRHPLLHKRGGCEVVRVLDDSQTSNMERERGLSGEENVVLVTEADDFALAWSGLVVANSCILEVWQLLSDEVIVPLVHQESSDGILLQDVLFNAVIVLLVHEECSDGVSLEGHLSNGVIVPLVHEVCEVPHITRCKKLDW